MGYDVEENDDERFGVSENLFQHKVPGKIVRIRQKTWRLHEPISINVCIADKNGTLFETHRRDRPLSGTDYHPGNRQGLVD